MLNEQSKKLRPIHELPKIHKKACFPIDVDKFPLKKGKDKMNRS